MALFRPFINVLAQMWFTLDAASAVRHGKSVADRASRYVMVDSARPAPVDPMPVAAGSCFRPSRRS